jgi:hypothetical protein
VSLDGLLEITVRDMCEQMGMPVPAGVAAA